MKVLHLATYAEGGAGIACRRISDALRKAGADSSVRFRDDFGCDPFYNRNSRRTRFIYGIYDWMEQHRSDSNRIFKSWGILGICNAEMINSFDADIIHLHWINDRFLPLSELAKIRKPLVWTLHDSWAFCGTEHYQNLRENDHRYVGGYASANFPASSSGIDLDKWIWRWKKFCWRNLKAVFAAPSRWEAECFEHSALFRGKTCRVIPNCLDTDVFSPGDGAPVRRKLGIPSDSRVILFGAQAAAQPVKGIEFLKQTLPLLAGKHSGLHLLCYGAGKPEDFSGCGIPCTFLGPVNPPEKLAELCRAADVFVCPSLADNLPNVCVEAVSCGTPVAAFRIGGVPETFEHERSGFAAEPYDAGSLAAGIEYCLDNHDRLSKGARDYALSRFTMESAARNYLNLYQELLEHK